MLQDENIRICARQADLVASENSPEIQQLRHVHQHLTVHGRHLETDKPACQSAVRCLAAQVVQIPQLRRTIDVERQQSNTLQAEVHRLGPQLCQNVDKFTEDVAPVASSLP